MAGREMRSPSSYCFDDVTVDLANFRVTKGDEARTLEPRIFDLLVFLLENPGRVLEKQELFEQVWKQAFVTDNALSRAVKEIRRAIGDDASSPRYIETVPKRGYRFIAQLKPSNEAEPPPSAAAHSVDSASGALHSAAPPAAALADAPFIHQNPLERSNGSRRSAFRIPRLISLALTVVIAASAIWFYWHAANLREARKQIPLIEKLAAEQKYFEAYDVAMKVKSFLPDDATIARLMPTISDTISVLTEPAGASVFLKRFSTDESGKYPSRQIIGTTPIIGLEIARGEYTLSIEKDGYAPVERTISSILLRSGNAMLPPDEPTAIEQKLIESGQLPDRMVKVPGGDYKLVSWGKPTAARIKLDDYFIDKYEVTNREYKEFVSAGGYLKKQYWKHAFAKNGKPISWEEAISEFRDRTGLPGPRNWSGQEIPEGKAQHPVTDITWYEAAAYAEFRGKNLPTLFQWEKAARNGIITHYSAAIMPWGPVDVGATVEGRANFKSSGTVPVDSFEFGMSPYGCYQMAGNVSEWCANETLKGFATAGGSWDDRSYLFGYIGAFPALYSSSKLGFRCALNSPEATSDQGAIRIDDEAQIPSYAPTSEANFKALLSHYRYDRAELKSEIVETIESEDWRREKITYAGAGDDRAIAYLYLPKNFPKPFQVINFAPAGDVYGGYVTMDEGLEMQLIPHIKSGRAVFAVVFKGFKQRERPPDYIVPSISTVRGREELINRAIDLRRGLDYLETRDDIDVNRIGFYGYSQGAEEGIIFTAVESRYKTIVFVAGGISIYKAKAIAEAGPQNFASHIRAPKLMLNGRYDEAYAYKTEIEPLYKLLGEPKRIVLYEGGHSPAIEMAVPVVNDWLDETLGPVKRD